MVSSRRWLLPPIFPMGHQLASMQYSALLSPLHFYQSSRSDTTQSNPTMSGFELRDHNIRNRKPHADTQAPPVPPKDDPKDTTSIRGLTAPSHTPKERSKPLPPVPHSATPILTRERSLSKPLPAPPRFSILRSTLLWVMGFCVWFLLIVLLLPVIMEKDAMPGVNRWLRSFLRS
jgi:hypothetical protein